MWFWSRGSPLAWTQVLYTCAVLQLFSHNLIFNLNICKWLFLSLAQCPTGWLANGRSCFTVRRTGLTWSEAQQSCKHLAATSHLADLKNLDDLFFVSSHLQNHNNLLMLWTGLSDQQVSSFQKYTGRVTINNAFNLWLMKCFMCYFYI